MSLLVHFRARFFQWGVVILSCLIKRSICFGLKIATSFTSPLRIAVCKPLKSSSIELSPYFTVAPLLGVSPHAHQAKVGYSMNFRS
ncbi:hypothetical protein [Bacillus pseudomycoides]|uniref:hypothetical protein n=1 Tax=Bacillus pseudomycoides TaxID=64104 RepID=UPI00148232E1|nr:hypothetical protein [Bacillus pseudomycoides]MED1594044.1 hypothetical protein [Bacillus pseudomycoides]